MNICFRLIGTFLVVTALFYSSLALSSGYLLDESWPKYPSNMKFEMGSGVAVDSQGIVYLFTRDIEHWAAHPLAMSDRMGRSTVSMFDASGAYLGKCWEYFDAVWKERTSRKVPGDDLISMLATSEATRNMSPNEYLGNLLLLIVGGNDTTRNSMSGGVLAMHDNPSEMRKLSENPGLIKTMVPEIIRWLSPVAHMCRTATSDIELNGQNIREGDKVVMWYLSGNRDESSIDQPSTFLIDRENPRHHQAFGFGIHRCIGSRLAEMQLTILWEEILKRFSSIEVTGDVSYLRSSFIRGFTELPETISRH